jgi:hypothetical protein
MHARQSITTFRLPRLAAAALVTTAVVHLALVPEHLREAPYAAVLFAGLSVLALALALLVVRRDDPAVWLAVEALAISALLAYVASRSVGLPSLDDDIGDWVNPLGIAAISHRTAAAAT